MRGGADTGGLGLLKRRNIYECVYMYLTGCPYPMTIELVPACADGDKAVVRLR